MDADLRESALRLPEMELKSSDLIAVAGCRDWLSNAADHIPA
jgi:hypothetical protein